MSEPLPRLECCLIGAPGAHKTELAEAFVDASRDFFEANNIAPLAVVDTNHLIAEVGRPEGVMGDHYSTLANYFNRVALEDRIRAAGNSFVAVGSIIDAVAHLNVRLQALSRMVQTQETEALAQREFLAGNLLQTYLMDGRWRVNFAWYVPLPEKVIIPGQESGAQYPEAVDAILQDINTKMALGIPALTGSRDEQVAKMVADLEQFYTGQTKEEVEAVEHVMLGSSDSGSADDSTLSE